MRGISSMNRLALLNYFYAVAQNGSISKGADSLGITQPTVTKMIKELEEIRGDLLFNRHSKGISLTQEGESLFQDCEKIFAITDDIFHDPLKQKKQTIKIGIEDFLLNSICQEAVFHLREKLDYLDLQFIIAPTDDLYLKLQANEIDFVISFYRPRIKNIHMEKLRDIKQILVSNGKLSKNKEYSFVGQRQINTKQKRNLPTIKYLKEKGIKIKADISSNNLQFAKIFTQEVGGISLLPKKMVETELKSKKLVHVIQDYSFNSTLKLCYTDESPNKILQFLKECLA